MNVASKGFKTCHLHRTFEPAPSLSVGDPISIFGCELGEAPTTATINPHTGCYKADLSDVLFGAALGALAVGTAWIAVATGVFS